MGQFRIVYGREIFIDAETEEEAQEIFENMDELDLHNESKFVTQVSIEEEND